MSTKKNKKDDLSTQLLKVLDRQDSTPEKKEQHIRPFSPLLNRRPTTTETFPVNVFDQFEEEFFNRETTHLLRAQQLEYSAQQILVDGGDPLHGEDILRTAVYLRTLHQPEDDDFLLQSRLLLGIFLTTNGKRTEAETVLRETLDILRRKIGGGKTFLDLTYPEEFARGLSNYAEVLGLLEKHDQAENASREALEALIKLYGEDNEYIAAERCNLSSYLGAQGKHEEGLLESYKAINLFEKNLGRNNVYTLYAQKNVLRHLRLAGRSDERNQLRAQWEKDREERINLEIPWAEPPSSLQQVCEKQWKDLPLKPFDPLGFFKPKEMVYDQLRQFVKIWVEQRQVVDPDLLESLEHELELIEQSAQ